MPNAALRLLSGVVPLTTAYSALGSFLPACEPSATIQLDLTYEVKHASPSQPICLNVPKLSTAKHVWLELDAIVGPTQQVCTKVEVITTGSPTTMLRRCDTGKAVLQLLAATTPRTYVIMPSVASDDSDLRVRSWVVDVTAPAMPPAIAPSPVDMHGPPTPPQPPPSSPPLPCAPQPDVSDHCEAQEQAARDQCANDLARFDVMDMCSDDQCDTSMIVCLMHKKDQIKDAACTDAIEQLGDCMLAPQLLFPMEIASFLLLATASVVLLCTLLRCCCRFVCNSPRADLAEELDESAEEDATEDEEFAVTPLPTGVKAPEETPQPEPEEEDEDALPGYTEVVEGAAVMPTEKPSSSSAAAPWKPSGGGRFRLDVGRASPTPLESEQKR